MDRATNAWLVWWHLAGRPIHVSLERVLTVTQDALDYIIALENAEDWRQRGGKFGESFSTCLWVGDVYFHYCNGQGDPPPYDRGPVCWVNKKGSKGGTPSIRDFEEAKVRLRELVPSLPSA